MGRLSALDASALTTEQQGIYQDILKTRNGNIAGPFGPWLHSPVLADRAQKLGAFCRFDSALPSRLSELAILVTAKQWRADVEWLIHKPIAVNEGISIAVIDALQAGRRPDFEHADEALVYELSVELYASKRVSDSTYDKAVEALGEIGVVDLVGILGYYALVAMTLNVFEVDLPQNSDTPLADL